MRIIEIVLSHSRGGAETVMHDLSELLIKKDIEVKVIIFQETIKYFKDLGKKNIISINKNSLYGIKKNEANIFKSLINFLIKLRNIICFGTPFNIDFLSKLRSRIVKYQPDLIHIHLPISLKLSLSLEINCPIIFTIHGDMDLVKGFTGFNMFFDKYLIRKALKKIDYITSACDYFFKIIRMAKLSFEKDKRILIPNGVFIKKLEKVEPLRLSDKLNLIYIGGARIVKGGDLLIKALPIIKKSIPEFKLYILREIPKNHFIKKFVIKNKLERFVEFVGFVDYPIYYKYIKAADIAILPSRTEGIAQSILEYMACGIPIVATKVGGTPEIIKNHENGILVNTNPESIAESIIKLYKNQEMRKKISMKNINKSKIYDWDIVADQYKSFFKRIIGEQEKKK